MRNLSRRPGATLVELLVVIALMIVLAGIGVAVSQSGVFGSHRVVSSADRASGWLLIARQRAMRDNLPRGVRFLLSPVKDPALNPGADITYYASTEAQYIESPDPWTPNRDASPTGARIAFVCWTNAAGEVPNTMSYRRVYYLSDNPSDLSDFDQQINVNDFLLLPEMQRYCKILAIASQQVSIGVTNPDGTQTYVPREARLLTLGDGTYPDLGANNSGPMPAMPPPAPNACRLTYQFAFQPAPRPLVGEPTLQLTGGTVIDVRMTPFPAVGIASPSTTMGVNPVYDGTGGYYFDVLFAARGSVMGQPNGISCLWVRDPEKTPHPRIWPVNMVDDRKAYDAAGEQALVTIYNHTGNIATHPPAWVAPFPNNDPYQYAKDGINSGL